MHACGIRQVLPPGQLGRDAVLRVGHDVDDRLFARSLLELLEEGPTQTPAMIVRLTGQFVMSSTLVQDSHSSEMSLQRGPAPEPGGAPEVPSWPCRAQPPRTQLTDRTLSPAQPWLGHCIQLALQLTCYLR